MPFGPTAMATTMPGLFATVEGTPKDFTCTMPASTPMIALFVPLPSPKPRFLGHLFFISFLFAFPSSAYTHLDAFLAWAN